ncbi:MAG: efflux RND transporter permease subunit [Deltaproteobacteria bacterium]|nr:efflux RND transporter permease subunit [Deltaproteobacteria bacterium]
MKNIITFFIRYPVWANVLMFAIFGFGLLFFSRMNYSFFPEMKPDFIDIQVEFIGASPQEVEEGVVQKIEENLDGLDGIERVTSVSRENFGTVTVEIINGEDIDKILQDVKNAVDRISSFPQGSEKPVIFEQKFRSRVLSIVLYGETDLYNLKYLADDMRDRLLLTPEISQVDIIGVPDLEFSIEVSEADLRRFKMTFDEIAAAVRAANINISGGKFETQDEEILIRSWGRNYYAKELHKLAVRGSPGGTVIYLRDVAELKERWEDVPDRTYYNTRNAVILNVSKTWQEDMLTVANRAKEIVEEVNASNQQIQTLILDDRTISLRQRLTLLSRNGIIGLVLVITLLGLFLNLRLAFWVSLGIPFSFAGMFIVALLSGITINVISLMGMIIVVGILVDDAIVVGENIYAHYERGEPAMKAAINGTHEMLAPVFTAVITTVIAFLPFFFLAGGMGKFIWHMALVVIVSLLFSLVEAFLVLPSHLAHSKGLHPHKEDSFIRKKLEKAIHFLTYRLYAPCLKAGMNHKWIIAVIPAAFVMITIGLLRGGFIGLTFFPFVDGDTLPINVSLVSGRQESDTNSLLAEIEKVCWQVNGKLKEERADGRDVILGIKREIGSNETMESGSHAGQLTLQLLEGEVRQMDSFIIANRIREDLGPVPEVQNISFGRTGMWGKPVEVSLMGSNLTQLKRAREMLVEGLKKFRTLRDVVDSEQEGRREVNITLKPRAYALGLKLQDVVGQVRQGFFGQEIQRIQRGRDEIRVWVRYREEDRAALGFLDQMRIRLPNGVEYPFSELADYRIKRGINTINHLDKKREIKVDASLVDTSYDLPPILAQIREELLPEILSQVQGVHASFEGQSRGQLRSQLSIRRAFPPALIGMFILVILVFRSYAQAGLIFSLIPLGIIGAIWGHGIQGIQLNTLSLYGIIALSGIVINDGIVFVDQINRNLRSGQKIYDAVYNAGISRLRPILLTTLTTAIGLTPILSETSRQAQFLIPMAVSVAYGLLLGTFILLIELPAAFLVLNKLRVWWASLFSKHSVTPESVEPAVKELKSAFVE